MRKSSSTALFTQVFSIKLWTSDRVIRANSAYSWRRTSADAGERSCRRAKRSCSPSARVADHDRRTGGDA